MTSEIPKKYLEQNTGIVHARIQKVLSTLTTFFYYYYYYFRGGRIQIPLSASQHRPTSETPFKWRFVDGQTLFADFVAL